MSEDRRSRDAARQQRLQGLSPEKRAYLTRLLGRTAHAERLPIPRRPRTGAPFPSSYAQQRLWFLDRLDPGSSAYTTLTTLRLDGEVDASALAASLTTLVARHEVLRTTFVEQDGQPYQVIGPPAPVPLVIEALHDHAPAARRAEASRRATAEAQRGFDLARGPLLRATLLRLGPGDAVLLLAMHHIVTDGWSMGVLLDELRQLYAATPDTPTSLPPLPIQYADFAAWQREWLEGPGLAAHLAYWRQQLAGVATLALPADRPRPPVASYRGGRVFVTLASPLTAAVRSLAQREGVTLFMTLLAAFQVVLARYTGQPEIVVGAPTANRTRAELEGLIGFFVNTLVLRTDVWGDPSFREVLHRVRRVALEAYAHQEVPFERLVEELQPARDLSRNPLFQVTFQLQNLPAVAHLSSAGGRVVEAERTTAMFDLAFDVWETDEGLSGQLEYNSDLFDGATIERLAGHYRTLLAAAVAAPETSIATLPLMPAAEHAELLRFSTGTAAPLPATSVPALVAAQAKRTPQALAVVDGTTRLDYATLNRQANQLAWRLRTLGAGPDRIVGVCLERSPRLVVALLAVLKAGAAYLPLDPTHPRDRLALLLDDARAAMVVGDAASAAVLPRSEPLAFCDVGDPALRLESDEDLGIAVASDSLAYVIYTSGSTGTPKGVMIPRGALLNHALAAVRAFDLGASDRVLQFASPAFDVAFEEMLPTLVAGGAIVIAASGGALSITALERLADRESITVLNLPSSYWYEWMREIERRGSHALGSLRLVIVGSEPVARHGLEIWGRTLGQHLPLMHAYGLSETTITSLLHRVEPDADRVEPPWPLPVGRPLENVESYVLDERGTPTPIGVPGELYIGGAGLARGYTDPRQDDSFVPHPFCTAPGNRLFRTGDRARLRSNGEIELLGRLDAQLKIAGVRMEPAEIEAALERCPAIARAVVVAHVDAERVRLVGCVVWRDPRAELDAADVREWLAVQLPAAMLPDALVAVSSLPMTNQGKVNRARLRALADPARVPDTRAVVAPRSRLEHLIADIWRDVLGVVRVGRHDNFFDRGGRSLLLVRVHARLCERLAEEIPLLDLFRFPTVATLAAHLQNERQHADGQAPRAQHAAAAQRSRNG